MTRAGSAYASATPSERARGRDVVWLLWSTSRPLTYATALWVLVAALLPPWVVFALGAVIADVPATIRDGLGSAAGHRLQWALVIAALVYAASLMVDPIGSALGSTARDRITGAVQTRLITALTSPAGVAHLEDPLVLDRLSRAEGSLTGFFPGDAPVTWAGLLASRLSGILGCVAVAVYCWWIGLGLLCMWLAVRKLVLSAVIRQATEMRGQTVTMRRAWYLLGVGSKVRDAKEVRVFGLADFIAERFRREYREALAAGSGGLRQLHIRALLGFLIVLTGYGAGFGIIAARAHQGSLALPALAVLFPMIAVTASAGSVSFDDITLAWTLAGLPDVDRLERDLSTAAHPLAHSDDPMLASTAPHEHIRFSGVHFSYGPTNDEHDKEAGEKESQTNREVLRGLDLELVAGTATALVGVNGAGKSTLISLLCRLRDPDSGVISVDGVALNSIEATSWQRRVAIMPQDPVRYPVSAYDNIAFGAIEHRDDSAGVHDAARLAGFDEVAQRLPAGYDTLLARELPGGVGLSGGQWQRLALARALFATRHGASVLVLDEPTAALDIRSEARFYQHFFDISRGITTLVISHRFATVRRAQRICVLDAGVITEQGSHEQLLELGGVYAGMYRQQASRFGAMP